MPRKMLVADLLCGAGGSSTGCQRALREMGLEMDLVCLNHWDTAIATHTLNHPQARHICQDISTVRPHIVVPEGYLDLLMASPSCTHHSVARGGKPTSDQQRSDPWHIITWLTELRVKRLIIENVWEFVNWGPVDVRTGKPVKSRKGEYFNAWIDTIRRLGFDPEWRKLNAADFGDATTRQRFILMARSDRRRVSWPMPTHAKRSAVNHEMFTAKPWTPARDIIDWEIKGKSIFGRKKALAPKTLARIYAGAVKFDWPEPFLVILRNHMDGKSIDGPLPTIAANGTHIGLAQPMLCGNRTNNTAKLAEEPVGGITTTTGGGQFLIEPVIVNMKGQSKAVDVDEPLPTQTSHAGHIYLAEPFVMGTGQGAARAAGEPLPTITTGGAGTPVREGCARPMLVEPFILNRHGEGYGETRAHSVEDPTPTANCRGAGYLIEPFIATVAHGNDAGDLTADKRRVHGADEPLGTIHAGGGKFAVVEPFVLSRHAEGAPRSVEEPTPTQVAKHSHVLVSPYYGSGSGETCSSAEQPLPTVTAKARFGMVVPVTHTQGGNHSRDIDQPLQTITTAKGGELAMVVPVTHAGGLDRVLNPDAEPLPTVTGANRGELAFISAAFGEREGQAPRIHDVDDPTPTICATGRVNLVEATPQYDILFRMLEPHELAAAMGFNSDEVAYEFAGTKTEKIKQIGNAVSVSKMKACVAAIMSDAAPMLQAAE